MADQISQAEAEKIVVKCLGKEGPQEIQGLLDKEQIQAAEHMIRQCYVVRTDQALMTDQSFRDLQKSRAEAAGNNDTDKVQQLDQSLKAKAGAMGGNIFKGLLSDIAQTNNNIGCDLEIVGNGLEMDLRGDNCLGKK